MEKLMAKSLLDTPGGGYSKKKKTRRRRKIERDRHRGVTKETMPPVSIEEGKRVGRSAAEGADREEKGNGEGYRCSERESINLLALGSTPAHPWKGGDER